MPTIPNTSLSKKLNEIEGRPETRGKANNNFDLPRISTDTFVFTAIKEPSMAHYFTIIDITFHIIIIGNIIEYTRCYATTYLAAYIISCKVNIRKLTYSVCYLSSNHV